MSSSDENRPQSPDNEPTEETPLISGQEAGAHPQGKLSRFTQLQRAHLIIPLVFLGFLAGNVPVTTSVEILRVLSCRFWWNKHNPSRIPSDGRIPAELCNTPDVQKLFSQFFQAFILLDLCGGLITSSPLGTLSAKFGRKPLLIIVASVSIISSLVMILALPSGSLALIFLGSALGAIGGPRQFLLLGTMFVVDSTSNPGPVLSVLEGSIHLGLAISFASGGLITARTGNLLVVFWVQVAICASILLYCILIVPETFGREQRAARSAEVAAERVRQRGLSRPRLRSRSSSLERIRDTTSTFARPFGLVWPRRDPITGKRNNRLLILSIAISFAVIGAGYMVPAWLVFAANRFHATPEYTGYVLSVLSSIKTVYLMLIFPAILKWGRPFFNQRWRTNNAEINTDSSSSQFDVYMLAVSWFVDVIAILGIGLSKSLQINTMFVMLVSIGSGAAPCISSIVSASVEPLARGEALAAITLFRAVSESLSPIILGSIMNATTDTNMPQAVFFVASTLMAIGVGLATSVQDSDRYISPEEHDAGQHSRDLRH